MKEFKEIEEKVEKEKAESVVLTTTKNHKELSILKAQIEDAKSLNDVITMLLDYKESLLTTLKYKNKEFNNKE